MQIVEVVMVALVLVALAVEVTVLGRSSECGPGGVGMVLMKVVMVMVMVAQVMVLTLRLSPPGALRTHNTEWDRAPCIRWSRPLFLRFIGLQWLSSVLKCIFLDLIYKLNSRVFSSE